MTLPEMNIMRNEYGKHAWNRWMSVIGAIVMSLAFIKEAAVNSLVWTDYIGYATGITIMYTPVVAVKLLKVLKGETGSTAKEEANVGT